MQYLPDTNIFIKAAKGYSLESEFLSYAIKKKQIMISSIVAGEFLAKAEGQEEANFERLVSVFKKIIVDMDVARQAAKYRKESLKIKRAQMLDCFLAAQAKIHRLTLVTNNKADFPMKDIRIITP